MSVSPATTGTGKGGMPPPEQSGFLIEDRLIFFRMNSNYTTISLQAVLTDCCNALQNTAISARCLLTNDISRKGYSLNESIIVEKVDE